MPDNMTVSSQDDALVAQLPASTPDGKARAVALAATGGGTSHITSLVEYRSAGELLIIDQFRSIGDEQRALELARKLVPSLRCSVFISGLAPTGATERIDADLYAQGVRVAVGRLAKLSGHLGQFEAVIGTGEGETNLARHLGLGRDSFDLVLDLSVPSQLRQDVVPAGYYAPQQSASALERALAELPDMVGEFEKPKFFNYDPDICAHGSSGLTGCTRCIDTCPTQAIASTGDKIEVNPYLCQGAGSCATACPTGAITYTYPAASELQDTVRALLKRYRQAGGRQPCLLFHDSDAGKHSVVHMAGELAEHVLPLEVEEIGAVGLDTWLAALAYGASHVALLCTPAVPASVRHEIKAQLGVAHSILSGMGYAQDCLLLIEADSEAQELHRLGTLPAQAERRAATFAAIDEKRTTIRLAVDHLYAQASVRPAFTELPAGAPFGEIEVDGKGCTLCMACVQVCPHAALSDGAELPQLLFDEWNCVQCGLCEVACPEHVITRAPRFIYDPELRRTTRTLHEEAPFCCIVCGKPFSTQSMITKMEAKLKGHWMFQKPEALKRMQMCEDCRVKDMLVHEGLIDTYNKP